MPPKKVTKLKEKLPADPVVDPTAIPPALPPSVEEAYRRKCVQLKQRTNEVEEENDATRIRLARIRRQIEKMRVERAFLLEQLTRRTSTNVEDSDGSPSPPPTPKDKPLRTKRGHRKPSMLADLEASMKSATSSFANQNLTTLSPSSEAFSHTQASTTAQARRETTNGISKAPKKPADAFGLFSEEVLKKREEQGAADDEADAAEELSQAWKDLPDGDREAYEDKHKNLMIDYEKDLAAYDAAKDNDAKDASAERAEATEEPADASHKDKVQTEDKSKSEAGSPAKEDEEMKDGDKDDDKTEPDPEAESSAPPAEAETQDEDVEMRDNDSEAQPDEKKPSAKAD